MKNDSMKSQYRINEQIRAKEVRIVGDDVEPKVYPIFQALKLAEEKEMDLVEISPNAQPPVCRIIDIIVLIAVVVGVFLMSTHGNIHSLAISQKALILGITTAITVVFYTVWPVRLLREYGSTLVIGWGMFIGGIMLMPFSKFWAPPGRWDWVTITLVAIVVVFGTIVSFSCYLKGVMYLGPVKSSLFACMEPLVSTILTIFLLHQAFVAADIVGIALIIVSVTSLAVNDVIKEAREKEK